MSFGDSTGAIFIQGVAVVGVLGLGCAFKVLGLRLQGPKAFETWEV